MGLVEVCVVVIFFALDVKASIAFHEAFQNTSQLLKYLKMQSTLRNRKHEIPVEKNLQQSVKEPKI